MDSENEKTIIDENYCINLDDLDSTMSDNKSSISDASSAMKGSSEGEFLENNFKLCLDFYKNIVTHHNILKDLSVDKTDGKFKKLRYATENLQIEELSEDELGDGNEDTTAKRIIERSIRKYKDLTAKTKENEDSTQDTKEVKNDFPILNTQMSNIERIVLPNYRIEFPIKIDLFEEKVYKWPLTEEEIQTNEKLSLIFERFKIKVSKSIKTRTDRIAGEVTADKSEKSDPLNELKGTSNLYNPALSEVYFNDKPIFANTSAPKNGSMNLNGKEMNYLYFTFESDLRKYVVFWYKTLWSEFDGILITRAENTDLTDFIKDDIWCILKDVITQDGADEAEKQTLFQNYLNRFANLPKDTVFLYESKNNLELDHIFYQIDRAYKDFRKKINSEPIFIMTISSEQNFPRGSLWRDKLKYLIELSKGKLIILDIQIKFKCHHLKMQPHTRQSLAYDKEKNAFKNVDHEFEVFKAISELKRESSSNNHLLIKQLVNIENSQAKQSNDIVKLSNEMLKSLQRIENSQAKQSNEMLKSLQQIENSQAKQSNDIVKLSNEMLKSLQQIEKSNELLVKYLIGGEFQGHANNKLTAKSHENVTINNERSIMTESNKTSKQNVFMLGNRQGIRNKISFNLKEKNSFKTNNNFTLSDINENIDENSCPDDFYNTNSENKHLENPNHLIGNRECSLNEQNLSKSSQKRRYQQVSNLDYSQKIGNKETKKKGKCSIF